MKIKIKNWLFLTFQEIDLAVILMENNIAQNINISIK